MISSAVTSGRRRHRRLDRRRLGRRSEPLGELGMLGPPVEAREAEVEIAERADHRDGADRGLALERLGLGLELDQHAIDLLDLALAPVGPALVLGPQEALVARQQRGIEQAVGHRLLAQRHPAVAALAWEELAALVLGIEIFADHRRVEEIHTLDRQRRDLANRVVLVDVGVGRDGRKHDAHHLHLLVEPGLDCKNPDLARIGRGGRVVELHLGHGRSPQFLSLGRPPLHAEATCGISVSFSRTLRATSISCCQVVESIGTPFCSRSSLRARSGSPGVSTSATPGRGLADFTQVMKVSTSSSKNSVPPIDSGSMMIDSMLFTMSVPSLIVRGECVLPPVSAPARRSQITARPPPLCRPNGRMAPYGGLYIVPGSVVSTPAASISRPGSIWIFLLLATRTLPIATWLVAKSSTIGSLPLRGTAVQSGLVE